MRRPIESELSSVVPVVGEDDHTSEVAAGQDIFEVLAGLPDQQRAVIVLRVWEDLSVADTATMLGIAEGTVKSYTTRALDQLREFFERQERSTNAHR
jgi:RNA polymerase sigma factor (sigma-70 family)